MAKKLYVPVNGLSKEIKKFYVSVNGVSKKVTKAYVSVNGLSKLFFVSGGGSIIGFWFYYSTIIEKFMRIETITGVPTPLNNDIYKRSNGLVFYCLAKGGSGYNHLFTFTTDRNAMNMDIVREDGETTHIGLSVYMRLNDDTWFYDHRTFNKNVDMQYPADFEPNCVIVNSAFDSMSYTDILTWILNNMIYADDFAEDYQVGQTYNLVKADMEKTIRKFLAVYLFKMIPYKSSYSTPYTSILTNIENIVNFFLQHKGNNDIIDIWADFSDSAGLRLGAYYSNDSVNNVEMTNTDTDVGYTIFETDAYLHYSSGVYIDFNGDGTVTYENPSWTADEYLVIGKAWGIEYMHLSNVGLKFGGTGHSSNWVAKLWNGYTNLQALYIWTDGTNIYNSVGSVQYVLNRATDTWIVKTWNGFSNVSGERIWTDGSNYYYSQGTNQYVLDKATSTWSSKTWYGLTNFDGHNIWSDGTNIYYSYDSTQYVLNKSTSTWSQKTWNGLTSFRGQGVWTDGNTYYYSYGSAQYVLNKATSTWSAKAWNGLTNFFGINIWTDGDNVYHSGGSEQNVLNKVTSTWNTKVWTGITSSSYYGSNIWKDGNNIYFSRGQTEQFVLE